MKAPRRPIPAPTPHLLATLSTRIGVEVGAGGVFDGREVVAGAFVCCSPPWLLVGTGRTVVKNVTLGRTQTQVLVGQTWVEVYVVV